MSKNKKIFAAGNPDDDDNIFSTNAVIDYSNITVNTVASLGIQYGFEILPECQAASDAGYTTQDRHNAVVWYGPTMDKDNFYYCAYVGSINFNTYKSSILIARRRSDGSLIYAINCDDYTLDTGETMFGPMRTVCRMGPAINNETLYLVTASVTNIGPQIFAVNKYTGSLIWARGFYPPEEYIKNTHKEVVKKRHNYSEYFGSNARLSDLNPIIKNDIVIVGVSSNQNLINTGTLPNSPKFVGYPQYTDQGHVFGISLDGHVEWKQSTCARLLKEGDVIINSGKKRNPFPPNKNSIIIGTITNDKIINPNISGKYAQSVYITPNMTIDESLVANFWSTFGQEISTTDIPGLYNLTQILAIWVEKQSENIPFQSIIYISGKTGLDNVQVTGQHGLFYVKDMFPGDVLNEQDAHALNYWGNSVWGAPPSAVRRKLFYGTGQSHYIPLEERLHYSNPQNDYYTLKIPVVDAISTYIADQTPANLLILNQTKDNFLQTIKNASVAQEKSPRGLSSYSNSIMGLKYRTGDHIFGVRTIPSDTFNFFITGVFDPLQLLYPNFNSPDGDVCTGVFYTKINDHKYLAATTKTALCSLIDITNAKSDDTAIYSAVQYVGPDTALGGINYQTTFADNHIYACCSNASYITGSRGSQGQFEQFVSRLGDIIPTQSFVSAIKICPILEVVWNSQQDFASQGTMSYYNQCVFAGDGDGTLYARNSVNGHILWKFDTKSSQWPMGGGPTSACAAGGQILWINNYSIPALSVAAGSNGISFRINQ